MEWPLDPERNRLAHMRAMIEDENERTADEIRSPDDCQVRHCLSAKYFSAAATIQQCASNFSSLASSYLTASLWSCV